MMKTLLNLKAAFIVSMMMLLAASNAANAQVQIHGANSIEDSKEFPTLKEAFDEINATANQSGRDIEVRISESITDNNRARLNEGNWNSLTIYPTEPNVVLSGGDEVTWAIISLFGANNVTIDGRVNRAVDEPSLTIRNTSNAGGHVSVEFLNSAQYNTVKYCIIEGQLSDLTRGIVFIGSSSSGDGNSHNIIRNNKISGISNTERPINAIASNGTNGRNNQFNQIIDNEIFNWLNPESRSNGIILINASDYFVIRGNSFYETEEMEPTGSGVYLYYAIRTNTNSVHHIEDNYIGGNSPLANGKWSTKNGEVPFHFTGIFVAGKADEASIVRNNTIRGFDLLTGGSTTNHDTWDGIFIQAGNVDVIENTIGAPTGTSSILVKASNGDTFATAHGILVNSSGVINIIGNSMGSIEIKGADDYSHSFEGLYLRGSAGITTIADNLIGSTETAKSINVSSAAAESSRKQDNYGIYSFSNNTIFIKRNTVANLHNAYAGTISTSRTRGIRVLRGSNEIEDNVVYNISSASNQAAGINSAASVIGIESSANTAGTTQLIRGNTVYNLNADNNEADNPVSATGIYFSGPSNVERNVIERNFVHSLGSTSESNNSLLIGILLHRGNNTVFNNVVSLGDNVNRGYRIFPVWDNGGGTNSNFLYFNTLRLSGNVSEGTGNSVSTAIWNQNSSVRDYRNNIFINERLLNNGGSDDLYAIRLAGMTNATVDYNNYWAVGDRIGRVNHGGPIIGLDNWKTATSQDANSLAIDPDFQNDSGDWTSPQDFRTDVSVTLPGISLAPEITKDFDLLTRLDPSKMGAFENNNFFWVGGTDSDFAKAENWQGNIVPPDGADITFAANPIHNCHLDQDRSLRNINITNDEGAKVFVLNGHNLSLTGELNFSNGATLDAIAAGSVLTLAGTSAQTLPVGSIVDNELAGLELNNGSGFTQNADYIIHESFTLTNGAYSIGTNTLTLNGSVTQTSGVLTGSASSNMLFGGSGASTILPAVVLNNLTINRADGINMTGDVSVGGTLALTSGTLTLGANKLTLSGNSPTGTGSVDASDGASELIFNNNDPITLLAAFFGGNDVNNLSITASGGVTSQEDFTVIGILNLQAANPSDTKGSLDMFNEGDPSDERKTLTMGASATTIGQGDVTGRVKRTTIEANTNYTFGSQFSNITFTGGTGDQLPDDLTFIITIGTPPPNDIKDDAVLRYYEIIRTGGSTPTRFNLTLRYLPSELNGNEQPKMVFWDHHVPYDGMSPHEHGVSFHNTVDNYMVLASHGIGYLVEGEYTGEIPWPDEEPFPEPNQSKIWLFADRVSASGPDIFVWIGPKDDDSPNKNDWDNDTNWADNCSPKNAANGVCNGDAVPFTEQRIFIQAAPNLPSENVPSHLVVRSFYIEQGGVFDAEAAGVHSITVHGSLDEANGYVSWSNQGTFIPGTSTVTFKSDDAVVSGNTDFYNLTITDGAKLSMIGGSRIGIGNEFDLNATGVFNTTFFGNTIVEYNGAAQTVISPEDKEYSTLILSGSGAKTMPTDHLNILGNFTLIGTASATAASELSINGHLTIGEKAEFNTGDFNHTLKGDFDNNGTFTAAAGKKMTFNGTANQSILGDQPINFQQMEINNPANMLSFNDLIVHENLILEDGIISTHNSTITIPASGMITGGSAASHVSGKLARIYDDTGFKEFPVGKDGEYLPMALNYTELIGTSTVTAESFTGGFPGAAPDGTAQVGTRYWNVSQTGASTFTYDITLDGTGLTLNDDPVILKFDDPATAVYLATKDVDNYTATGLTTFSDFALGDCQTPVINIQPSDEPQLLCNNQEAESLFVIATGYDLSYQWYKNTTDVNSGGNKVGTNTNTYTPETTEAGPHYYYVVITGECGTATSTVSGEVTVDPLTVAGTATNTQTICSGSLPADLSLSGHTGTIQWQSSPDNSNWTNIFGANETTLTDAQIGTLTATTWFRALVTSGVCPPAHSNEVEITIYSTAVTDHFRSVATGNWSDAGTWESSADGDKWCTATFAPNNQAESITIQDATDVTVDINSTAKNIIIENGGKLTANANITVAGNWTNNGTFNPETSLTTFSGSGPHVFEGNTTFYDLTVGTAGFNTEFGNTTITILNDFNVVAGTMVDGTSTFIFTGADGIIGGNSAKRFYNLVFENGANIGTAGTENVFITGEYTNNGTFTQAAARNITFEGGKTQTLSGTGTTTFGNYIQRLETTVDASTHSFTLSGTSFDVQNPTGIFRGDGGDATVTFAGDVVIGTGTGQITFNNVLIPGKLLNNNNKDFNVKGNWTNNGSYAPGSGTVILNGTLKQTIGGTAETIFYGLTINNSAGIQFENNQSVSNQVTLTDGIIATNTNTLTVLESGNISGGSATSHVSGKLARVYDNTGLKQFPVGTDGEYLPMELNYTELTVTSTVTAESFTGGFPGTPPPGTAQVGTRYWNVTQSGAYSFAYEITLDGTGLTFNDDPVILKYDDPNTIAHAAELPEYTATGLTSFSDFALGENTCQPPNISEHPSPDPQTLCHNAQADELSVTATGDGLNYKWFKNTSNENSGGDEVGTNTNTYTPLTDEAGTLYYYVVITGDCGTATSTVSGGVTVYEDFTAGAIETDGETICFGAQPDEIGSVTPASGGDGSITYSWRSSTDGFTNTTLIDGATSESYTPPVLTETTAFRRYATDDGTCIAEPVKSTGEWTVTVHPQFTAGEIKTDGETICYNTAATIEVGSETAASGGDGAIEYTWRSSADNFDAAIDGATAATYTPGTLTQTTAYRRYANDGTCNTDPEESTGEWTVTVEPLEQFRSRQSGNWNDAGTWERSIDGGASWGESTLYPGEEAVSNCGDPIASIRNEHTVTMTSDISFDGNVVVENGGTLVTRHHVLSGDGDFTLSEVASLLIGSEDGLSADGNSGNIQMDGTLTYHPNAHYIYTGTSKQVPGDGLPAAVASLTIDNPAGLTLASDQTITGVLYLTAGIIQTGDFFLIIENYSDDAIVGGSEDSFVNGTLVRGVDASNTDAYLFPIGNNPYTPVEILFTQGSNTGTITATTTASPHPEFGSTGFDADRSVNRFWTLEATGIDEPFAYNATFTWIAGDEELAFDWESSLAGKWDGSNWAYPAVDARTEHSTTIIGETSFSDFQVANNPQEVSEIPLSHWSLLFLFAMMIAFVLLRLSKLL